MAQNPPRIIAIDPGYDRLGVAIFSGKDLEHSECFSPSTKTFTERLVEIRKHLHDLIQKYNPEVLAIETLFFSVNKKTALKVAEARGVILMICAEHNLSIYEYSPQEIKTAVTGVGNADKKAVAEMVGRLVSLGDSKRIDDEIDAIAVGITHQASIKGKISGLK